MLIHEIRVFEQRIEMNFEVYVYDSRSFKCF